MTTSTVLVADDDAGIRTVIGQALERAGYQVRITSNAATLWRWISDGQGDVVITDVVMPDENGLDLIPRIRKIRPELRVIVMSAQSTLLTAVKATERGAFEYLPKPFDLNELIAVVRRALEIPRQAPRSPADDGSNPEEKLPLIGRSPAMQEIYRTLARLMVTDLTVLINGESGTGKELVARALHDYGKRRAGPFVAINMAAIPRELIESELFGHEKGSFTGAVAQHVDAVQAAARQLVDVGRKRGHTGLGHDLLGEGLGALQPSGGRHRSEARNPLRRERIRHARHRRLRARHPPPQVRGGKTPCRAMLK